MWEYKHLHNLYDASNSKKGYTMYQIYRKWFYKGFQIKKNITWYHGLELVNPFWVGFQMEIWHEYPDKKQTEY